MPQEQHKAQTIVEYTIITAFLLLSALMITKAISTKNIEQTATFGIREKSGIVVPPMTP